MVMCVFTLPCFPYVFKVITDRFLHLLGVTSGSGHGRPSVGQDARPCWAHGREFREYSHVAFPRARISDELITMLREECAGSIEQMEGQVVVKHLYIERRLSPLNMYLASADDDDIAHAAAEYGDAIKQLAAANIFPGEKFSVQEFRCHTPGSCRVLRLRRAVLSDRVPVPRYPASTAVSRDGDSRGVWYTASPGDIFPEEFEFFLLTDPPSCKAFRPLHREFLLILPGGGSVECDLEGKVVGVFPYPVGQLAWAAAIGG